MALQNIYHLRDKYIGIPFLYFLLKNMKSNHYIVCKEIDERDSSLFPFERIIRVGKVEYFFYCVDKFFLVFLGFNYKPINYLYSTVKELSQSKERIILHAHMGQQGFHSLYLMNKLSCPLVVTFYGADMSSVPKLKGWLKKYAVLFDRADAFVVEGPCMMDQLIELGCPKEKITIIKLLIPTADINFRLKDNPFVRLRQIRILMCANFYEKKGYFTAIHVIKKLTEAKYDVIVDVIGSGPLEKEILALIESLSLNNVIQLHGKMTLDQIYDIATVSDVFLHPSQTALDGDTEGGAPTIISQMQALGLPVVSTYHADIPNVIPAANHFLGVEEDIVSISEQFHKLLDIKDWAQIQIRGKKFVDDNHSKGVIQMIYEELYSQL